MKLTPWLLVAGLVSAAPLSAEQSHPAAPMAAPATSVLSERAFEEGNEPVFRTRTAEQIIAAFTAQHPETGPRIAVFWNDALPSRVSDWHGRSRSAVAGSGEVQGQMEGNPVELRGQSHVSAQSEQRGGYREQRDSGLATALQGGLISTLREARATVVDQAMAQRITDNALEDGTFNRLSPDQLRLQMRALGEHADYVLELTARASVSDYERYQIRVLSVSDASVLATFTTSGQPPKDERESVWVAAPGGYERRERPVPINRIGRELALQSMDRMVD